VLRPVSQPAPTVACAGAVALVEPFLVEYYGNGRAQSVSDPLGTATTKQRFGLVQPEVVLNGKRYLLDVRFRMLQPHELAGAQGFPKDYQFAGTKTEAVKQIGNAVPRGLARALMLASIGQDAEIGKWLDRRAA
jgi:DNA (cytosine-5)-methyltransferase 1